MLRIGNTSAVTVVTESNDQFQLTIQPVSGLLTGSFRDEARKTRKLRGIIVKENPAASTVSGIFTTNTLGGSWVIEP